MKDGFQISLPHLPNDIVNSARKTKLCAYAVALEGWRRGLRLKWYTKDHDFFENDNMVVFGVNPPGRLFSLSSENRTHYFFRTRGDKVTNEAVRIGSDKELTKVWLKEADVPVPSGKGFEAEASDDEILQYGNEIGYPLVLKPTNGSLGNGVITNIKNDSHLKNAIDYVRNELGYKDVIVEKFVLGEEYRIYVIDAEAVAAYNRVPANIVGDGIQTVEQLIEDKNQQRKKNPRLFSCLINIDKEIIESLGNDGYTLESVPEKGKLIYLREKTNISSGGDPIDVTDTLANEIKEIAVKAIKAIPGLYHGGVDIIVNHQQPMGQNAVVIELNPTAQIGGILYPIKGKARDIPAAIIDYYFPETRGMNTHDSRVYFDFNIALEPLQNRSAVEIEIPQAPLGTFYAKKYTVSGQVNRYNFHRWLKNKAIASNLNGYIKKTINGEIEVVVGGTNKNVVSTFKDVITSNKKLAKVTNVKEEILKEHIKIGFEISEEFNVNKLKSVESALKRLERDLKDINKEIDQLEKENKKMKRSTSWKFAMPFRKFGKIKRKVKVKVF
ncbi:acylphosphatase [Halalkalibacter sp. AB-rgal2]|uniref:acylphosphatase n=1 Tax=Halalkalibacter sp. AB-rgal2 TaxID=3242695 RepID=UPI00359DFD31